MSTKLQVKATESGCQGWVNYCLLIFENVVSYAYGSPPENLNTSRLFKLIHELTADVAGIYYGEGVEIGRLILHSEVHPFPAKPFDPPSPPPPSPA